MKKRSIKNKIYRPKNTNTLWLLMALLLGGMFYLFWYNSINRELKSFNYSTFIQMVEQGKVEKVTIQDQYVQGKLKDSETMFESSVMPNDKMWTDLKAHNVNTTVVPADRGAWGGSILFFFLLPFLVLMAVFYFRQSQGGGTGGAGKIFNVGKSKAQFFSPNTIKTTFKDVAGADEAKDGLRDIIKFLKNPKKFSRLGAKIPRGILLKGAPGNGKTLLAKAVAGESSVPFFSISGSDFVEVFVGVGASRVRDLFLQAKKNAPCIVFIDEIDAVGRQRGVGLGGGNDEREQTLNQLLSEMDGFSTEEGSVIVLAASNRPDVLDQALLRPGRFDRLIEVPYPDMLSREKILEVHARKVKLAPDVDLNRIARGTPGFSGADLENLMNEAALLASKTEKKHVEIEDFEKARDQLLLGAERKTMVMSEKEKTRTAYHESGHALLNLLLPETDPFHKVTIVPRGRALGASWSLPEEDKYSESKSQMLAKVMVALGGLISEKLKFDEQTTGASNDLEHSTKLVRRMVCKYGMSDLGPIVFGNDTDHPYLGRDIMNKSADYSESTATKIDAEISKIITSCQDKARKLLADNKEKLEKLAKELLEKETLQAAEVYELLDIEPRETHSLRAETEVTENIGKDEN